MGKLYPYSTRCDQNIMEIFHIYGSLAIFLLICNNQDTESESREMEGGVAGPIFTH